jgi:hypothetical protein
VTIAAAVSEYADTVHAAVRPGHHVVSPLGAWLVLALAGPAAEDPGTRSRLEEALGMPVADAARVAGALLDAPHPAVAAAVGLWWREDAVTDRLTAYADGLPRGATREPLGDPTIGQARLDAWARAHSLGLIERFPIELREDLLLVLASALATRVRWRQLFDLVPSAELRSGGPFADAVSTALRSVRGHDVRLVRTSSAGLVGAHVATSGDGLAVVSVLVAPDVDRTAVLAAAHEVAVGVQDGWVGDPVSLFEVPLGPGDVGDVVEDRLVAAGPARIERGVAVLPSWRARTQLDLLTGPTGPAFLAAGEALAGLLPPQRLDLEARQVAVASYTREGFEAAAITAIGVRATALLEPREVPRRTLHLRFDRPYAAVAVAVRPPDHDGAAIDENWYGLPVFSAWVAEPAES